MAMMHTAPAETADAAVQVATMAHTSLVNNPRYNLLLNSIGVGTVASTILIKFWIYAVLTPPLLSTSGRIDWPRSTTATFSTRTHCIIEPTRCLPSWRSSDSAAAYSMNPTRLMA